MDNFYGPEIGSPVGGTFSNLAAEQNLAGGGWRNIVAQLMAQQQRGNLDDVRDFDIFSPDSINANMFAAAEKVGMSKADLAAGLQNPKIAAMFQELFSKLAALENGGGQAPAPTAGEGAGGGFLGGAWPQILASMGSAYINRDQGTPDSYQMLGPYHYMKIPGRKGDSGLDTLLRSLAGGLGGYAQYADKQKQYGLKEKKLMGDWVSDQLQEKGRDRRTDATIKAAKDRAEEARKASAEQSELDRKAAMERTKIVTPKPTMFMDKFGDVLYVDVNNKEEVAEAREKGYRGVQKSKEEKMSALHREYQEYKEMVPSFDGTMLDYKKIRDAKDPIQIALGLASRDYRLIMPDKGLTLEMVAKEYLDAMKGLGGRIPSPKMDDKPDPKQHKGRIIRNNAGKRWKSDGITWKPLN